MHRKITVLAVSAALLASGGLAACGGDDEATPAAAAEPAAQQHESPSHEQRKPKAQREAASKAAGPVAASIEGFAFAPQNLTVEVGQEITWTNDDSAPHTVTATSGADFDSGTMAQGATYSWKATKAGTVEYFCAIHPSMVGTITVE